MLFSCLIIHRWEPLASHTSLQRASYGVSIIMIYGNIDRVITASYCSSTSVAVMVIFFIKCRFRSVIYFPNVISVCIFYMDLCLSYKDITIQQCARLTAFNFLYHLYYRRVYFCFASMLSYQNVHEYHQYSLWHCVEPWPQSYVLMIQCVKYITNDWHLYMQNFFNETHNICYLLNQYFHMKYSVWVT